MSIVFQLTPDRCAIPGSSALRIFIFRGLSWDALVAISSKSSFPTNFSHSLVEEVSGAFSSINDKIST